MGAKTSPAQVEVHQRIVPAGGYVSRNDAIDIFITDFGFHTQKPSKPASLTRNYAKYLKGGKAQRTYGGVRLVDDHTVQVDINVFDEQEILDLLAKQGKSMLRIYLPTGGLPAGMALDMIEKIQSLKKKAPSTNQPQVVRNCVFGS